MREVIIRATWQETVTLTASRDGWFRGVRVVGAAVAHVAQPVDHLALELDAGRPGPAVKPDTYEGHALPSRDYIAPALTLAEGDTVVVLIENPGRAPARAWFDLIVEDEEPEPSSDAEEQATPST